MKKQFLALLCVFIINGVHADDTHTRLKATLDELKGNGGTSVNAFFAGKGEYAFFTENCLKHLPFWTQAAEQGEALAQSFLGSCYAQVTGVEQDDTQAVAWYRKAADQGDGRAIANLKNLE
ncbi:MAG: hypothetical protein QX189_00905 [Methylococcales bacterium]